MRYEKSIELLNVAMAMAESAEGLTYDEIMTTMGCSRRKAERLREAVEVVFPQMEVVGEPGTGERWRYRIPGGLRRMMFTPPADELQALDTARAALVRLGQAEPAEALSRLNTRIRAAVALKQARAFE